MKRWIGKWKWKDWSEKIGMEEGNKWLRKRSRMKVLNRKGKDEDLSEMKKIEERRRKEDMKIEKRVIEV